jgi:hypothetical protein
MHVCPQLCKHLNIRRRSEHCYHHTIQAELKCHPHRIPKYKYFLTCKILKHRCNCRLPIEDLRWCCNFSKFKLCQKNGIVDIQGCMLNKDSSFDFNKNSTSICIVQFQLKLGHTIPCEEPSCMTCSWMKKMRCIPDKKQSRRDTAN